MNIEMAKSLMGVQFRISESELKSVYRKRAIELHPDTNNQPNAAENFRNLKDAYQFLLKNIHQLKPKPSPRPTCPTIFRTLDGKSTEAIVVPKDALKEDDLCIYYMWKNNEYRTVIKKGTTLPTKIKIIGIDMELTLVEEIVW